MKEWMSGLKLFSKNEMLKWPFFIVIIYPLNFYRFAHIKHGNSAYYHAKLHTISGIQKQKNRGSPPTVMNPTKPKKP
jgi:hypothetical protein